MAGGMQWRRLSKALRGRCIHDLAQAHLASSDMRPEPQKRQKMLKQSCNIETLCISGLNTKSCAMSSTKPV